MTLLLVPGLMTDADLWREVEGALSPFGPTFHADLSRDGSIEAMAQRTLADAPACFILVGFSMGGYVAREIARSAPERVQAMVLIATSARGDPATEAQRKAAMASRLASASTVGLSRSAVSSSLHPENAGDETLIGRIFAMGARLGPEVFRRQLMLERNGDLDRLSAIRCPTFIVAGEQDRLRSIEEAKELQDGIPGAELTVMEGAGHMIPMEVPERLVDAVVRWLGKVMEP
jgi:pimeloyl-ACP methyl ester carboxylesterase